MGCAVTEERYKELINYIRGWSTSTRLSYANQKRGLIAFQMHEYCVTVVYPHLIAFLLTDTYYIISYSEYLPTAMYVDIPRADLAATPSNPG